MKSRKFFTLLALMVGFMTLASCKGQAKNNEAASDTETTGKETAAPVHLNKADFLKKVYNYEASPNEWKYLGNKPAIIDFYADWCGPCKTIAPSLEQLAKEYAGQINIYKVDVDKDRVGPGIRHSGNTGPSIHPYGRKAPNASGSNA